MPHQYRQRTINRSRGSSLSNSPSTLIRVSSRSSKAGTYPRSSEKISITPVQTRATSPVTFAHMPSRRFSSA